jgi:zinc transporter ZupT
MYDMIIAATLTLDNVIEGQAVVSAATVTSAFGQFTFRERSHDWLLYRF